MIFSLKKFSIPLFTTMSLLTFFNNALAWEIEFAGGRTGQAETTLRVAINKEWNNQFFDSPIGYFSGYWSGAYTHWNKGAYGRTTHSLSASPVFTYNFHTNNAIKPFIEVGIGVSLFSTTKVGSRNIGSAFHFEDRLGIGAHFGNNTIGIRAIHYSNAGLKKPNSGIESYSLYYSHKF